MLKRAASLFNSFCSNVAKQFACFFVAHFSVASKVPKGVTKPRPNDQTFSFNMVSEDHV